VLTAYAQITHERSQGTELAAAVHRGERIARAEKQLLGFVADLIAVGVRVGELRDDAEPGELASYCLHALTAAGSLASAAAVRRLVAVTMARVASPYWPHAQRDRRSSAHRAGTHSYSPGKIRGSVPAVRFYLWTKPAHASADRSPTGRRGGSGSGGGAGVFEQAVELAGSFQGGGSGDRDQQYRRGAQQQPGLWRRAEQCRDPARHRPGAAHPGHAGDRA